MSGAGRPATGRGSTDRGARARSRAGHPAPGRTAGRPRLPRGRGGGGTGHGADGVRELTSGHREVAEIPGAPGGEDRTGPLRVPARLLRAIG